MRHLVLRLVTLAMLGALTACASGAAASSDNSTAGATLVGSWHVTVHVDGSPTPFDALYAFAPGGVFSRVDGRNNAPALGTWTYQADRVAFDFLVFAFDSTGKRIGTIMVPSAGKVDKGKFVGTFTATEVDTNGNPITTFHKTGTVEGTRIKATGP